MIDVIAAVQSQACFALKLSASSLSLPRKLWEETQSKLACERDMRAGLLLGSLSTRVFETRTVTGSKLFSLLTKCSLPVVVRVSKTLVLKLPTSGSQHLPSRGQSRSHAYLFWVLPRGFSRKRETSSKAIIF